MHNSESFPKINHSHQTPEPGSSEITNQNKKGKTDNPTTEHIIFKLQKNKGKKKFLNEARLGEGRHLTYRRTKISITICFSLKTT